MEEQYVTSQPPAIVDPGIGHLGWPRGAIVDNPRVRGLKFIGMGNKATGGGQSRWLIIAALVIAALMGLGRLGAGLIDLSGSESGPGCEDAVAWDQAASRAGEDVTVRGPVVDTTYAETSTGQPTFLNVGRPHPDPDRFTVVIWGDLRPRFDRPPELAYYGEEICVTGEVQMYEGVPEIELNGPGSISVAD